MGPTETYSMFQMRGKEVGAAYTMRPEERQHGAPPHWNSYVTVKNVDEAVKKAEGLGAKVFAPPFDVMDAVGWLSSGSDWRCLSGMAAQQAHRREDPERTGALCWTELTTSDTKAAEKFYTQMFGWTPKHSPAGSPMEYTEFSIAGTPSIGMMPKPDGMPAHIPSYWMPYFQVTSVDQSASKAKELGGKTMIGPQDIPGRAASQSSSIRRARCSRSFQRCDSTLCPALAGLVGASHVRKTQNHSVEAEALPGRADPMPVPDTHFVNQHRLTPPFPDGLQRALFGMGCFWGAEKKFWSVPGVYSTAVGYAGGTRRTPPTARCARA
jgi:predicted enzyme related to lactoylglutathione lyase